MSCWIRIETGGDGIERELPSELGGEMAEVLCCNAYEKQFTKMVHSFIKWKRQLYLLSI